MPACIQSDKLLDSTGIEHYFSTREKLPGDDDYPVGNRKISVLKQVHGADVYLCREDDNPIETDGTQFFMGEYDAIISRQQERLIAIRTADCVPVLLAAGDSRLVAGIHCGWRSTAANIIHHVADKIRELGYQDLSAFTAAVGPAICAECFEVGQDVITAFAEMFKVTGRDDYFTARDEKYLLDLKTVVADLLKAEGVDADRLDVLSECTFCEEKLLHSHRRDAEKAGRQLSIIGIK